MSEWVTDKDALYTLIMLDGIRPGDEVRIVGDPEADDHRSVMQWDDAILRIEAGHRCTLLSAPNGPELTHSRMYTWINKEMQARIVIAWRRPCAKEKS